MKSTAQFSHLTDLSALAAQAAEAKFWYWINARHAIYLKRLQGAPPPWTDDPILQEYRFTNPFRENDTTTVWIRENLREPYADSVYLWFLMALARHINWPPTLKEIMANTDLPAKWRPKEVYNIMKKRKDAGQKVYTSAYVLSATAAAGDKLRYTTEIVLDNLWKNVLPTKLCGTIEGATTYLQKFYGTGSFLAGQITTDLIYTRYLCDAPDKFSWAAPGPGSMRGLNRIFKRPIDWHIPQAQAIAEMRALTELANSGTVLESHVPLPILISDIQNCLCDGADKYNRVLNNEGRPRQRFVPYVGSDY